MRTSFPLRRWLSAVAALLLLPSADARAEEALYTVEQGDSLAGLAKCFGTTTEALRQPRCLSPPRAAEAHGRAISNPVRPGGKSARGFEAGVTAEKGKSSVRSMKPLSAGGSASASSR